MNKKEIIEKLFGFTEQTYYVWKKENRPIIELIETYFLDNELEEFVKTNKIEKLNQIKKILPLTRSEKDIDIAIKEIDKIIIKDINHYEYISDPKIILADFLIFLYSNSFGSDKLKTKKYEYIVDQTFIDNYEKIDFIDNNDINYDFIINMLADLNNDFEKLINIVKKLNKYVAYNYISYFIAPILDMKYNKKYDNDWNGDKYSRDFGTHICNMYNLPKYVEDVNDPHYNEEKDNHDEYYQARKDMKKEMIVGAIDSFLYKIKNKN